MLLFYGIIIALNSHCSIASEPEQLCLTAECVRAAGTILNALDTTSDPCEDFYQFACGGFELRNHIPIAENKLQQFTIADNVIRKQLRALLEDKRFNSTENSVRQKLRKFYNACLDEEKLQETGVRRMRQVVKLIGGFAFNDTNVTHQWSFNRLMTKFNRFADNGFFVIKVEPDDKDTKRQMIQLHQDGLGMGRYARDYYLGNATKDAVLVAYAKFLETLANIVQPNETLTKQAIYDVVRLEQRLAAMQQTQAELQDQEANYNKVNISWLQDNFNFLNWTRYFDDTFKPLGIELADDEPVIVFATPYLKKLTVLMDKYLKSTRGRRAIQNYLVFLALTKYAEYSGGLLREADNVFKAAFEGKSGQQERWQTCMEIIDEIISFPLGAMWIERHFDLATVSRAVDLVNATVQMFRKRIAEAGSWMDERTRQAAYEKMERMAMDIGVPPWLFNDTYMEMRYADLIVTNDFSLNQLAAFAFSRRQLLSNLRKPYDRSDWFLSPVQANAYYDPRENKIVLPAGILTPPFFYPAEGIPNSLNFGSIGAVTGHEITHGFDSIGRQYDKTGSLVNWWSDEADKAFQNRTKCLVDKYDAYTIGGYSIKGDQTLPENIADDGAIKVAYQTYKHFNKNLNQKPALVGLDLTPDQLFFVGWAQTWCTIYTPESLRLQVLARPHSPVNFRVNGPLSNFDEFSKAYNCQPEAKMNSRIKCSVW